MAYRDDLPQMRPTVRTSIRTSIHSSVRPTDHSSATPPTSIPSLPSFFPHRHPPHHCHPFPPPPTSISITAVLFSPPTSTPSLSSFPHHRYLSPPQPSFPPPAAFAAKCHYRAFYVPTRQGFREKSRYLLPRRQAEWRTGTICRKCVQPSIHPSVRPSIRPYVQPTIHQRHQRHPSPHCHPFFPTDIHPITAILSPTGRICGKMPLQGVLRADAARFP